LALISFRIGVDVKRYHARQLAGVPYAGNVEIRLLEVAPPGKKPFWPLERLCVRILKPKLTPLRDERLKFRRRAQNFKVVCNRHVGLDALAWDPPDGV
jgi:hypothetical protein